MLASSSRALFLVSLAACGVPEVTVVIDEGGQVSVDGALGGIPIEPGPSTIESEFVYNPHYFGEEAFVDLQSGKDHMCLMRLDGTITCFGSDTNGRASPPPGAFTSMDISSSGGCAQRADTTWACWGFKEGMDPWLAGGANWPSEPFHSLALGGLGACALRPDGSPLCWGDEPWDSLPPGPYATIETSSTGHSFCGIRSDTAAVECHYHDGDLPSCYDLPGTYASVSFVDNVLVAVRTDGGLAAGDCNMGPFHPVPAGNNFVAANGNITSAAALRADGSIWIENVDLERHPQFVLADLHYIQIAVLAGSVCGRADTGQVSCAGLINWLPPGDTGPSN